MSNAITMGIFWHLIGAASAACFYAPFKQVKQWSWETMWSVGGIVSWLILPWTISACYCLISGPIMDSLTSPPFYRFFCSAPCGASAILTTV